MSNSVVIKWNKSKDNGAPIIHYKIEKEDHELGVRSTVMLTSKCFEKITGLVIDSIYTFYISAKNMYGYSAANRIDMACTSRGRIQKRNKRYTSSDSSYSPNRKRNKTTEKRNKCQDNSSTSNHQIDYSDESDWNSEVEGFELRAGTSCQNNDGSAVMKD